MLKNDIRTQTPETFRIGICTGRPVHHGVEFLKKLGLNNCIIPSHSRNYDYNNSNNADYYVTKDGKTCLIEYIPVKASDIVSLTNKNLLNAVVCYGDIWYDLPVPNFNIKPFSDYCDELGNNNTYISLVAKEDFDLEEALKDPSRKITIASEYSDTFRILKRWFPQTDPEFVIYDEKVHPENPYQGLKYVQNKFNVLNLNGKLEAFIQPGVPGLADLGLTIVQSGETLKANGLKVIHNAKKIGLNLWLNTDMELSQKFYFDLKKNLKCLIVEGIDGSGKSTIINKIKSRGAFHDWLIFDRHRTISRMTTQKMSQWSDRLEFPDLDSKLNIIRKEVVVLDIEPELALERIESRIKEMNKHIGRDDPYVCPDQWESLEALNFYRLKYRELSAHFGLHLVPVDRPVDEIYNSLLEIKDGSTDCKLPTMKKMNDQEFEKLDLVVEGESKEVRSYNNRFDIIRYKPSVYSHKAQKGGFVEGSDEERLKTTRNLLYVMATHGIKHTYAYIGNRFILAERVRSPDPPPVEVCVKQFHIGTHKHIYYDMFKYNSRLTGQKLCDEEGQYLFNDPIVRFDWRNPNHIQPGSDQRLQDMKHTSIFVNPLRKAGMSDQEIEDFLKKMFPNGVPLGDYAMADELANHFIDVERTKIEATKVFKVLEAFMKRFNVSFQDVCLMFLTSGDKLFGEVSQDCGRYKLINSDGYSSLDKDVWRAGGSSDLVLEKWKRFSALVEEHSTKYLNEWQQDLGIL